MRVFPATMQDARRRGAYFFFSHAVLRSAVVAVVALSFLSFCGRPSRNSSRAPSFILISLDTTRADHLGFYGYERDTTPFLDELAKRAIVFEDAISSSQNTLLSHASLLTGLSTSVHGATPYGETRAIHPAFTTLAEDLSAHGYRTAAFLAHADWLSKTFSFDQGFERFTSKYRSAELVLRQARRWLSRQSLETPYFLFLHLYDVHSDWGRRPYDAPDAFRGRFVTRDFDTKGMRGSDYLGAVNLHNMEITPDEVAVLRDQYDEGLAYVDHRLDVFFDSLDSDSLEHTWIIVVADHGEGFLEHGRLLHASFHDEIVRVPLMLVPPRDGGGLPQTPVRISEQVRLIDVRPTVLSLAGLPAVSDTEGVDLVPCMRTEDPCPSLPATLEDTALRFKGFKLIRDGDLTSLFDLDKDPGEQADLVHHPEMQERLQNLTEMLDSLLAEQLVMRERILQGEASPFVEMAPEAEERIRALGYVQ